MNSHSLRQRRRRVALDRTQSATAPAGDASVHAAPPRERKPASTRPYSEGARRSRQLKTTDLIPKRWWSVAGMLVALATIIALLNLLHHYAPGLTTLIGEQGMASLSLEGQRGIGAWFCNLMLILTSCASLQLYLLRQHRRDDYRGSYRIWLWSAGLCLMASVLTVSNLPGLVGNLWVSVTGATGGSVWMTALKLAALSMLIVRGIVEVRHSRLALMSLILVFFAYGLAALVHEAPEYESRISGYVQAAEGNLLLLGSTLLFVSVIAFARFVYLEANGLAGAEGTENQSSRSPSVAKRRRQPGPISRRRSQSSGESQKPEKSPAIGPGSKKRDHGDSASADSATADKPVNVGRRKKTAPPAPATNDNSSAGPPETSLRRSEPVSGDETAANLSKSERRRLKKLKRREQRRAA